MFSSAWKTQVTDSLNSIIATLKAVTASLASITATLKTIEATLASNQEKIMSGLDDLSAQVAALEAEELQIVQDFQTLLNQNQGDSDAAVEALSQRVAVVIAALKAGDPVPPVAS